MSEALGIWLVRAEAQALGAMLRERLGGTLYCPWRDESAAQKSQFASVYRLHALWVMVAASGIAVRFLEGLARGKHEDPALVVLDEAGRYAVSLLSGHEGGANALAYRVANAIGAVPVITTASEALRSLVLGIGCRQGVSAEQIEAAVARALDGRALSEVREVATVDLKAREPGLISFCKRRALPLRVFARDRLVERPWVKRPSDWVREHTGLEGVCEPCALLACSRGRLVVPKTAWAGVAVAVVEDRFAP